MEREGRGSGRWRIQALNTEVHNHELDSTFSSAEAGPRSKYFICLDLNLKNEKGENRPRKQRAKCMQHWGLHNRPMEWVAMHHAGRKNRLGVRVSKQEQLTKDGKKAERID